MSRAFQCDNCGDLFPGDAHKVLENGAEVCLGCFRTGEALGYFAMVKLRTDRAGDWTFKDFCYIPPHTGEHSQ